MTWNFVQLLESEIMGYYLSAMKNVCSKNAG